MSLVITVPAPNGGIESSVNQNLFFDRFPEKWQGSLKVIDERASPNHFNHLPSAWEHAMSTPSRWTKQVPFRRHGLARPATHWTPDCLICAARAVKSRPCQSMTWVALAQLQAKLAGQPQVTLTPTTARPGVWQRNLDSSPALGDCLRPASATVQSPEDACQNKSNRGTRNRG